MGPYEVNEKDWKLFRQKLSGWQEAYMDKLNGEYVTMLGGPGSACDILPGLKSEASHPSGELGRSLDGRARHG